MLIRPRFFHGIALQVVALGGMFGLFFSSTPVLNLQDAMQSNDAYFKCFYHHMRDHGIVWPPSAYEALFVTVAHDAATLEQTVAAADGAFAACAQLELTT